MRNLRTRSRVQAKKIRVLSRSSKTPDSRMLKPVPTLDAVFLYAPHAFAMQAAAIQQAVALAQVQGHLPNCLRPRLHLLAVLYRSQHPSGSAKAVADSLVVLLGCFVVVAVSAVAIPAPLTSGRHARRRICGRYDATRTPPAKMSLIMSPRPVGSSVGVRM